ncbi:MAG: translation initiation factor IF-2 [Phycisphaerales bacterium JB040]
MAKRVFEIAKDLGIKSKAVVEKCHAEGIPSDVIKNHMSTVSAGLEATIREWFAGGEEQDTSHTAVETSEKVDIEKVRETKPRKKAAKARKATKATRDEGDESSTATAVADRPAPSRPGAAAAGDEDDAGRDIDVPAGLSTEPPEADEESEAPGARPAAKAPEGAQEGDEGPGDQPKAIDPGKPSLPEKPAPMNVPTRPKVVTPAGPRIEEIEKKKVKLGGPKVVRVEAADPVEAPRPRAPRGPRGPGGGFEPGMPPGEFSRGGGGRNDRRRGGSGVPSRRRGEGQGAGWTEADLAEREARLQRSGGYLKARRQQIKQSQQAQAATPAKVGGRVAITEPFTIKDLSAATGVKGADIVKKLFMQGVMATINSGIETEKAQEIMMDWDIELEVTEAKSAEQKVAESFEARERVDERPRGPIVTILGHVDHGKTSLLDRIRHANVAEGEAGGITQATSAFRVSVDAPEEAQGKKKKSKKAEADDDAKKVVFIDTPGHEAFTEMRARGANVTDIVVLVVAADDGVMPQTAESISHAKAAGVPIIVALNKIDKPEATDSNIQRILGQLAEHELNPTDWGGETEVVRVSALKNEGIQDLLEILDLQSQLLELTADFDGPARGTVIEARPEGGRGNVANILIQDGKLAVGDFIVMGRAFGRVRDITDDRGNKLREALPPMPVQVSGIDELPDAGDKFFCVETLKKAEQAAQQRRDREREEQLSQPKMTLDRMFSEMSDADMKEIRVVLKADVQGSVDVLKNEIEKVASDNEEVKVRVIHAAVGGITESDILLANASQAVIVGFNVIANAKGRKLAETKGVEIRNYQVIYDIVEDITKAAEGLLAPELRQEVLGHAEVRKVFKVSKVGAIAGCYVTDGVVERNAKIRVTRNDVVIEDNRTLEQLKRFKDDAAEVRSGMECGMKIAGYDDIKEGDVLECYKQVEVARSL